MLSPARQWSHLKEKNIQKKVLMSVIESLILSNKINISKEVIEYLI